MTGDRDDTRLIRVLVVLVCMMVVSLACVAVTIPFVRRPAHVEQKIDERLEVTPAEVLKELKEVRTEVGELKATLEQVQAEVERLKGPETNHGAAKDKGSPL